MRVQYRKSGMLRLVYDEAAALPQHLSPVSRPRYSERSYLRRAPQFIPSWCLRR